MTTDRGANIWVAAHPWDTLAIRDGRAFRAGVERIARAMLPSPSTMSGALGDAVGPEPDRIIGPFLLNELSLLGPTLCFPAPAPLVAKGGSWLSLRPRAASGTTDLPDGLQVLETTRSWSDADPVTGHFDAAVIQRYLHGDFESEDDACSSVGEWLVHERHVGVALDGLGMAREGLLYAVEHHRLQHGYRWASELVWDSGPAGKVNRQEVPLGGQGRWVSMLEHQDLTLPEAPPHFPGGRVLAYLATPAIWQTGWQPPPVHGARLVAAAVQPVPMVTNLRSRDPAAGKRQYAAGAKIHWAAAAGSVFFLQFEGDTGRRARRGRRGCFPRRGSQGTAENHAADWVQHNHGTAWIADDADQFNRRRGTAGFGVRLMGTWSPEEETT